MHAPVRKFHHCGVTEAGETSGGWHRPRDETELGSARDRQHRSDNLCMARVRRERWTSG